MALACSTVRVRGATFGAPTVSGCGCLCCLWRRATLECRGMLNVRDITFAVTSVALPKCPKHVDSTRLTCKANTSLPSMPICTAVLCGDREPAPFACFHFLPSTVFVVTGVLAPQGVNYSEADRRFLEIPASRKRVSGRDNPPPPHIFAVGLRVVSKGRHGCTSLYTPEALPSLLSSTWRARGELLKWPCRFVADAARPMISSTKARGVRHLMLAKSWHALCGATCTAVD